MYRGYPNTIYIIHVLSMSQGRPSPPHPWSPPPCGLGWWYGSSGPPPVACGGGMSCLYVGMYACMHACMYVHMNVCMYVCRYVGM